MGRQQDTRPIAIVGAGGFGREVAMLIEQINDHRQQWRIVGFYDDDPAVGPRVAGYSVLGAIDAIGREPDGLALAVACGAPRITESIVARIGRPPHSYPRLVHPSVQMARPDQLQIGAGTIICAGCVVTVDVTIGAHVVLNLMCTVGHDASIGDYSAFMPACRISGHVTIGRATYWGTGACIIDRKSVGDRAVIGAGAVVVRDIPADVTAVGVPARVIRQ